MKYALIALTLFLVTSGCQAEPKSLTVSTDQVKYIYDGDTFYLACQPGYRCTKGKLGVRPPNIDTPEMKGRCPQETTLARRAKQLTVEFLRSATHLTMQPIPRTYDRYDRLLASVTSETGQDLERLLLDSGLARPYVPGRESWCPPEYVHQD